MSQAVEMHVLKARLFCDFAERVAQYSWVNGLTFNTGKDKIIKTKLSS